MAMFDNILGKNYQLNFQCKNCKVRQMVSIPKGITIKEATKEGKIICKNCGVLLLKMKEIRNER